MAITNYNVVVVGNIASVTVTSNQTPPTGGNIWYHWYSDGAYVATTALPTRDFFLAQGDQLRVEVIDSLYPDFDPIANAPPGYPARRSIWWCRSRDTDVDKYIIRQQKDGGDWTTIATIHADPTAWSYSFLTPRLVDLSTYSWRVIAVDAAGNESDPQEMGPEKIVRTPDAPNFTVACTESTPPEVTFTEA